MIRNHTVTNSTLDGASRPTNEARFTKVLNGRKQPIRGLWIRNGRYYAQLKVEDPKDGRRKTRRIPLVDKDSHPVTTAPAAVAEMERLRTQRSDNDLPILTQNPKLADYVKSYLESISGGQGAKKAATIAKEKGILESWTAEFGDHRLDQIKRHHVNAFVDAQLAAGRSPRTINLYVGALRTVLKRAFNEQRISRLPTQGMTPLKTTTPKRPFFNAADLAKLRQAAFLRKKNSAGKLAPITKNAQEFIDYVLLMAYCGARRNEALALRWDDVDFHAQQLTIGATGDTKNRTHRVVDFNPRLKLHLLEMQRRRAPDSQWLFPSPQRGRKDIPVKTFRESLDLVRQKAELPNFQFHDCRHHFISMCVMAGVDFMTIASWAGHRDGGILIGKVYGHLANEHRKRMAEKVVFEPIVFPQMVAH